jgi:hypothetical protein
MKPDGTGPTAGSGRIRIAAALCAAGVATGTLGGSLVGADAQSPSETVTVSGSPAHDADAPTTTSTTTTSTTATDPSPPTTVPAKTPPATTTTPPPDTTPPSHRPSTPTTTSTAPSTAPADPAAPATASSPTQTSRPSATIPAAPKTPYRPPSSSSSTAGATALPLTSDCHTDAVTILAEAKRNPHPSPAERAALHLARQLYVLRCVKKAPPSEHTTGVTASDALRGSLDGVDARTGVVLRDAGGVPTLADPTTSLALPGAAAVGVPNFFIDKFRIPVFLLPIYQAAGIEYGVRWEVLAAINEIETDYGRNLNVSSAGALGWMQFMPATWKLYGVDANGDGKKDPFNPVDAIFAAARYLKAAGAGTDLRKAIFSYNHADWYVDSVLMRAQMIGGLPTDLIGSLSGLTQGRFPVYAKARYAESLVSVKPKSHGKAGRAARASSAVSTRRGVDVYAAAGSPVIAVQDGTIVSVGTTKRLGRFVRLADAYGNTYTYAHLKKTATRVPVPKPRAESASQIAGELSLPAADPAPTVAATAGKPTDTAAQLGALPPAPAPSTTTTAPALAKVRLFAHPARRRALRNGGLQQLRDLRYSFAEGETLKSYLTGGFDLQARDYTLKALVPGRRVIAGTILGRIGVVAKHESPHLHFEIRPAGQGAPLIDPKPILDGWKLLDATEMYRAQGTNALAGVGAGAQDASIGQILLMSKEQLAARVLANPRIDIYSCGRQDIEAGAIDQRVLATLEFLAANGLDPTVTSLQCGHGVLAADGNVSEHSSGNAVDIAKVNGIPILDHQGAGSITDMTIRRLLTLQGTMKPHQIISLMTYPDADNTLALPDHADHIHVGFSPELDPAQPATAGVAAAATAAAAGSAAPDGSTADPSDPSVLAGTLEPAQWLRLISRIGAIGNPTVATTPSRYAIPASSQPAARPAKAPRSARVRKAIRHGLHGRGG